MHKQLRHTLLLFFCIAFVTAISCFFVCPVGTFIHDTLPYILGSLGWFILVVIFIIDKYNGGEKFSPHQRDEID